MCSTDTPPPPLQPIKCSGGTFFTNILVALDFETLTLHSRSGLKVLMFLKSWTNIASGIPGLYGVRTPALAYIHYAMLMIA